MTRYCLLFCVVFPAIGVNCDRVREPFGMRGRGASVTSGGKTGAGVAGGVGIPGNIRVLFRWVNSKAYTTITLHAREFPIRNPYAYSIDAFAIMSQGQRALWANWGSAIRSGGKYMCIWQAGKVSPCGDARQVGMPTS